MFDFTARPLAEKKGVYSQYLKRAFHRLRLRPGVPRSRCRRRCSDRVFFQSENGLIGTGPIPEHGMAHPLLTDAGGRPISALPGACTFDSAMSFGLIRGGHVTISVLGALQVDAEGHLANWMIPGKMVPGMGGAVDLVTGAKRMIVPCSTRQRENQRLCRNARCRSPPRARSISWSLILPSSAFPAGKSRCSRPHRV
jgi:acetate CoA/acetoacetate CoA-transferase beta subunit